MSLVNKTVVISGLQSRPELNGRHAKVISFDTVRNRYNVNVGAVDRGNRFQNLLALKEENLILNETTPGRASGPSMIENMIKVLSKAFGNTFQESNLGFGSVLFVVLSFMLSSLVVATVATVWTVFTFELFSTAESYGLISAERNYPVQLKRKFKQVEFNVGRKMSEYFQQPVSGRTVLFVSSVVFTLAKYFYQKSNSYNGYNDYYEESGGFSLGGVSLISLIFLALMVYKLDIPNNGLGALRNLNFFELMYLYNILSQMFGNGQQRGGYGRRGFGGYGGGRRRPMW